MEKIHDILSRGQETLHLVGHWMHDVSYFFSLREGCLLPPSLSINVITLAFSMGSRSFAFASAFFSYASIVSGLALFIRQQYLTKATAAEAVSNMPVFRFPWLIVVLRLIICKPSNMKNTDSSSSRFFTVSRKPV